MNVVVLFGAHLFRICLITLMVALTAKLDCKEVWMQYSHSPQPLALLTTRFGPS